MLVRFYISKIIKLNLIQSFMMSQSHILQKFIIFKMIMKINLVKIVETIYQKIKFIILMN